MRKRYRCMDFFTWLQLSFWSREVARGGGDGSAAAADDESASAVMSRTAATIEVSAHSWGEPAASLGEELVRRDSDSACSPSVVVTVPAPSLAALPEQPSSQVDRSTLSQSGLSVGSFCQRLFKRATDSGEK